MLVILDTDIQIQKGHSDYHEDQGAFNFPNFFTEQVGTFSDEVFLLSVQPSDPTLIKIREPFRYKLFIYVNFKEMRIYQNTYPMMWPTYHGTGLECLWT